MTKYMSYRIRAESQHRTREKVEGGQQSSEYSALSFLLAEGKSATEAWELVGSVVLGTPTCFAQRRNYSISRSQYVQDWPSLILRQGAPPAFQISIPPFPSANMDCDPSGKSSNFKEPSKAMQFDSSLAAGAVSGLTTVSFESVAVSAL
jgi:hypothetical protein